jgi:RHS repeat-associated protein
MSYIIGLTVLAQTNSSGATSYLMIDGQGSTRLLTDATGNITARFAFDAYGLYLYTPIGVLALPATKILYTGQFFDAALLWYYLRERFDIPSVGRFNRMDPFFGKLQDPSSINKFLYANGNPINRVDPSGKESLLSLALNVGLFSGLAGMLHGAIMGAKNGAFGALKGALIGFALGFALGFAMVYAFAGIAWVAAAGLGALGCSVPMMTLLYGMLIAGNVVGTGISVWEILAAKDPYERAAGISDLLMSIVGWGLLARALKTPTPTLNTAATGQIIGVSKADQSALATAIRSIEIDGQPAVKSIEAFGSRAGSNFTPPAERNWDLDIFVTLDGEVVNSPEKLLAVHKQLDQVALWWKNTRLYNLEIVRELDFIAGNVKQHSEDTPFIPLDESGQ